MIDQLHVLRVNLRTSAFRKFTMSSESSELFIISNLLCSSLIIEMDKHFCLIARRSWMWSLHGVPVSVSTVDKKVNLHELETDSIALSHVYVAFDFLLLLSFQFSHTLEL